jgi:hypothetical protein
MKLSSPRAHSNAMSAFDPKRTLAAIYMTAPPIAPACEIIYQW